MRNHDKWKRFFNRFSHLFIVGFFLIILFSCFSAHLFFNGVTSNVEDNFIRITMNAWPGYSYHTFLAFEKSFFDEQGVNAEVNMFDDYADSLDAFKSGGFDGFFGVYSDVLSLGLEGYSLSVVYAADFSNGGDVIISSPDIKEISDLKGKTIGVVAMNSFSHFFVLDLLKKNGLSESDVNIVGVSESEVLRMLKAGYIDAGNTMEPFVSEAIAEGYNLLATSADVPGSIIDVLAVKNDVIKESPEKVRRFIDALFISEEYLVENPEKSYSYIGARTGVDSYDLSRDLRGIKILNREENQRLFNKGEEGSLYEKGQFVLDFLTERGISNQSFNIEDFIDPGFVLGGKYD